MPMRRPGEDVGRGRRQHDLAEVLGAVQPDHGGDVAVVLRDVADADRGVDDDRPDRGDEDHEDRRGLAVAESGQRERQPGQRRHGAQHLEDRVEAAHRPDRLADQHAERDADARRRARSRAPRAAGWPSRCQNRPLSSPPRSIERVDDQLPACRSSTLEGGGRVAAGPRASSSQTTSRSAMHDQRRQHARRDRGRVARGASARERAGAPVRSVEHCALTAGRRQQRLPCRILVQRCVHG